MEGGEKTCDAEAIRLMATGCDATAPIPQDDDFHLNPPGPAVVVLDYNMESTPGEILAFAEQIKQNLCVRRTVLVRGWNDGQPSPIDEDTLRLWGGPLERVVEWQCE